MSQENKAVLRRFHEEILGKRNLSVVNELVAANFVDHSAPPGTPMGPEGVKGGIQMFLGAFPDLHLTDMDIIAEGDKVAARWTISGTHRGEFMGVAATGRKIAVNGMEIVRVEDGKFVERWEAMDTLGVMQQLGAIPQM